ncbi:MAG: large-conductance mechanosensitive channel protein MscL [Erysipelotrichales bacterium]|nr:large-conductance mechanosensitive channel protein MscL [Erysipelotrichales bacterium]
MSEKKGLIQEFKEFIFKGNVLNMAVGIIIGTAFTAIVSSLVADIIMPLIGVLIGGVDFAGLSVQVGEATITYGNFIQAIISFLMIALVLFWIIKGAKKFEKKQEPAPEPAPAEPSEEAKLLMEIRDALVKKE